MSKIPMTLQGASQLRAELERLKREERPNIIRAISEARAHGDLKENAEYHAAKEKQSFIEGRIRDIESKLAQANIIDVTKINTVDVVVFGATVHLLNHDNDTEIFYQLVGDDEANVKCGKISIYSPLARAVVGKRIGDVASVTTALGVVEYSIVKIEYV